MSERRYQPGYYRARAIAGAAQHGYAGTGGEQISIDLDVQISEQQWVRLTSYLSFSGNAGPISIERLVALGWDGSNDTAMVGIDKNEVDVEIKYRTPPGKTEESMDVEIKTGRAKMSKPMGDPEKRGFMANLAKEAARISAGAPPSPRPAPGPAADASGTNFPHGANAPPAQQQYKL